MKDNIQSKNKLKICFCASMGGHSEEILRLKPLADRYESILVTEQSRFIDLKFTDSVYTVPAVNRKETLIIPKMILITVKSISVILKEKPDLVISAGALATIPICVFAKLIGKKIIYIESLARADKLSLTGKCMKHISHFYIVQSKELLKYVPTAKYIGEIF